MFRRVSSVFGERTHARTRARIHALLRWLAESRYNTKKHFTTSVFITNKKLKHDNNNSYSLPELLVQLILVRESRTGCRSHVSLSPVSSPYSASKNVAYLVLDVR